MEGQSGSTRQVSLQIPFNRLEEMFDCNNLHSFLLYCKELLYFSNNSQSVSDNQWLCASYQSKHRPNFSLCFFVLRVTVCNMLKPTCYT